MNLKITCAYINLQKHTGATHVYRTETPQQRNHTLANAHSLPDNLHGHLLNYWRLLDLSVHHALHTARIVKEEHTCMALLLHTSISLQLSHSSQLLNATEHAC